MKQRFRFSTLGRLLRYLKGYRAILILSQILTVGIVYLTLQLPLLIGQAIDTIVSQGQVDFDVMVPILIRAGVYVGLTALLQWIVNICNNRMAYSIVYGLRRDAFGVIQNLPLSYLDSQQTGQIVSRIVADTEQVTEGLLLGFTQFFYSLLIILGTIGLMLAIDFRIALFVILITPLSLFVAMFIAKKSFKLFKQQASTRAEQVDLIDEMIGQHKVVVAFGHEDEALDSFEDGNERLKKESRKALFYSSLTNPSTRFVNNLVYAGVALIGALTCLSSAGSADPFTVGQLSALLSFATQYTKPFNEISGVVTEMQNALACAGRVFELLDAPQQNPDPENAYDLPLDEVDGRVSLDHVFFSYTPDRKLIEDFNLSLAHGQRVAIVGPTGCGKTTVINLLMRFYDADSGTISVSGHPVSDLTRSSLRRSYGMVLQETWLKNATVRENLAMARPDATREEIEEAARFAHAHSFIMRLPQGYDTVLGENGDMLSQGQKQLLCIARVMLSLPPMLILDEATSSIDTRTELRIQDAFAKMMQGRTSFVIAHRLSTIREADVILVMRDGKIVEQGTHDRLLNQNGFYAELYNSQFDTAN